MAEHLLLRLVYGANIFVAGWIGLTCLLTDRGAATVFEGAVAQSEGLRVLGALWLAIAVCSAGGLVRPESFAAVLMLQLVYKGTWLLAVAAPAVRAGAVYPRSMTAFFVAWVLVLPWVIPWRRVWG